MLREGFMKGEEPDTCKSTGQPEHGQPDMWSRGRSNINRPGYLPESVNAWSSRCQHHLSTTELACFSTFNQKYKAKMLEALCVICRPEMVENFMSVSPTIWCGASGRTFVTSYD